MTVYRPRCPQCRAYMTPDPSRLGNWLCRSCGHEHYEDVYDESTWLPKEEDQHDDR